MNIFVCWFEQYAYFVFFVIIWRTINIHVSRHTHWSRLACQCNRLKALSHSVRWRSRSQHITCKRGSAKLCVKRDYAFLYGIIRFSAPAQPKPLNRSVWNFARLIMSARLPDMPNIVWIGWLGAAPQIGELVKYNLKSFLTTLYLACYFLFSCQTRQTRRFNRFARTMAQTTQFVLR
jgi:hypothetical protein